MEREVGRFDQPSAAQTAAGNSGDINVGIYEEANFYFNVTAFSGGSSPSVTFTVYTKDPVSGNYSSLAATSAISATGITLLKISANLGDIVQVQWTFSGSPTSVTFSIGGVFKS